MHILAALGGAVGGALVAVPTAAIAHATPEQGPLHLPDRWWRAAGLPARAVIPVVLVAGGAAGLVTGHLPLSPALPAFWSFAVLGTGLAIIDLRRHRLPHVLTGTLVAITLICFTAATITDSNPKPLGRALAAGAVAATAMFLLAFAFPGQLGLGDVALTGAISLNTAWLSWQAVATSILSGLVLQALTLPIARTLGVDTTRTPLGPALLTGWLITVLAA